MSTVLEVIDVVQEYPGVKALQGVSLSIKQGEIRALVGENGAGKSTLIRSIAGIESPKSGKILVQGTERKFRNSAESQQAGITVVSQEFRLVPELTVADNVFLGHEIHRGGVVDRRATRRRTDALLRDLGLEIKSDTLVSSLTIGDRQLVEIARALSRSFDVLIMDEPTAALNGSEIETLHQMVRTLADSGKAVIYVSHHLDEVFSLCDTVSVLRDGEHILTVDTGELDEEQLVEHMLGKKPETFTRDNAQIASREEVLALNNARVIGITEPISFSLHKGEVLGLAGLVGSGRSEITKTLFGELPLLSGALSLNGKAEKLSSNYKAIRKGIFMLPEDRKSQGIVPHLSTFENALLSKKKHGLRLIDRLLPIPSTENSLFEKIKNQMRIKVSSGRQLISQLSGGNQQKALFGRALLTDCSVLILNEPTRGVDVGAKAEIYELIRSLADSGVAVLVSSSDATELATICDRCIVLFGGKQSGELRGNHITEANIVAASVGQNLEVA